MIIIFEILKMRRLCVSHFCSLRRVKLLGHRKNHKQRWHWWIFHVTFLYLALLLFTASSLMKMCIIFIHSRISSQNRWSSCACRRFEDQHHVENFESCSRLLIFLYKIYLSEHTYYALAGTYIFDIEELFALAEALKTNTALVSLNLSGRLSINICRSDKMYSFYPLINLTSIAAGHRLWAEEGLAFADALKTNNTLSTLNLAREFK